MIGVFLEKLRRILLAFEELKRLELVILAVSFVQRPTNPRAPTAGEVIEGQSGDVHRATRYGV